MTVQEARKVMGEKAKEYTDEKLDEVIASLTALADLAIDVAIEKRKK